MLHVVNGDVLGETIRAGGLLQPLHPLLREQRDPDDVVAWKDVLYEGPVRSGLSPINLAHERCLFIAAQGWEPYIIVRQDFGRRDAALAKARRQDEVVFWFESDLYDVLQLAQALDRLAARRPETTRFSWILVDRDEETGRHGFGGITGEHATRLLAGRQPVPDAAWPQARSFWRAFVSGDPERLVASLESPLTIPFLLDGIERLLAEYPDVASGLSLSERQVLDAIASGPEPTPASVFVSVQAAEARPFLGDLQVWERLERFAAAEPPLVERRDGRAWASSRVDLMSPDEPDMDAFLTQPIRLSTTGLDVLEGRRGWLAAGGSGRWIGGYQVPDAARSWRYDAASRRLVPPANGK